MNFLAISLSLVVSTLLSVLILRKNKSKWLAALSALVINVVILGAAYWILYNTDEQSRMFGIDVHSRYILVAAIPVITFINVRLFLLVEKKQKKQKLIPEVFQSN